MTERKTLLAANFNRAVLVKHLRSGQPWPYADAVYESELIFTGSSSSTNPDNICVIGCHPPERVVKHLAQVLVHEFAEGAKDGVTPYLDQLTCVEKIPGLSRWLVRVVVPYTD